MYSQEFDGGKLCDYEWGYVIEERIGETCDDGNNVSGDGCSNICKWECQVGYHRDSDWGGCVKDFLGGSVHPLAVDAACGYAAKTFSGEEGHDDYGLRPPPYNDFHYGVDIRQTAGISCKVNSITNGRVSFSGLDGYLANQIDIQTSGYLLRYLHGANRDATLNQNITMWDNVFTMGCTGRCDGRHLHLDIFPNLDGKWGTQIDSQLPEYLGYLGGIISDPIYKTDHLPQNGEFNWSETLYLVTKKY